MSHCNHNRAKFSTAVAATLQLGELRQRVPGVLGCRNPRRNVKDAVALGGSVDVAQAGLVGNLVEGLAEGRDGVDKQLHRYKSGQGGDGQGDRGRAGVGAAERWLFGDLRAVGGHLAFGDLGAAGAAGAAAFCGSDAPDFFVASSSLRAASSSAASSTETSPQPKRPQQPRANRPST